MKKTPFAVLLAALSLCATAGTAAAQGGPSLAFEARIDAGLPMGDSRDVLDTGFGYGVNAFVHLTPMLALYGGASRFEFGTANDGPGSGGVVDTDDEVEADGFQVGGRVSFGSGLGLFNPYAQAGALFQEGETGFEAGGGFAFAVGGNLSVTPAALYRKVDELEYVTVGVGLNVRV